MQKMNMKRIAEYIRKNFKPDDKVMLVLEGPVNKGRDEESFGYDAARYLIKTLTDPEVCGDNTDLYYPTIGKVYMGQGNNLLS